MIIGTRGSALAMVQTDMVVSALKRKVPDIQFDVRKIKTTGDNVTDRPLAALGGMGAFVKELDELIISKSIDCSVNSLKDVPVVSDLRIAIGSVLPRGPVEDVILSDVPLEDLPRGSVVGSSSVRRSSQLLSVRPDLIVKDIRGNVPTRVRKWKDGQYDAIVLAKAGLDRLGIVERSYTLDPAIFIPAAGQGAIAITCLEESGTSGILHLIDDERTRIEIDAERYLLKRLGGGCSMPIGVWADLQDDQIIVRAAVSADPKNIFRSEEDLSLHDLRMGLDRMAVILSKALPGGCSS